MNILEGRVYNYESKNRVADQTAPSLNAIAISTKFSFIVGTLTFN